MNKDADDKLDRAVRRAFSSAPELVADADDDARILSAVDRTLLAVDAKKAPSFRGRAVVYLVAAALCVGALAYAADHRSKMQGTTVVTAPSPSMNDAPAPEKPSQPPPTLEAPVPTTAESASLTPEALPSAPSAPKPSVRPPAVAAAPSVAAPTLGPAELFARANEARRGNETSQAVGLYQELQTRFPESREASTSRVALGRLLLDREGEPARALRLFDAYLSHDPSGALAEEARVGRALASMHLGDHQGERAAWRELLERHPGSVHTERARQRLVVLGD